jgi:hypothetical protein
MIIATRTLILDDGARKTEVGVRLHAPEKAKVDWMCRFEIDWPEGKVERWGTGIDAVQALVMALQMIAAEVYASRHHEAGRLMWLERGGGYGFPVTKIMRDVLAGDDRKFL